MRKLAGFADKSTSVAPTQTQTRNSSGTEIGTRYRYIDDTPLVPFNEAGNSATTSSSASGATAQTRSRPSNEYVLYAYGEPIAVSTDGNTSYFGTDILGSVRNVTDKYGAVQSEYNYDVFGNPYLSNLDNDMSFGYCGKIYDNGTGLYDYGFRDYSPNQARFTTIDPIRDGANWFSYVVNDPVNYVDLFGLSPKSALELISKHSERIKIAAEVYGVDPVGIASVIFQEKYYGTFADLKNGIAYAIDFGVTDDSPAYRSYGLAEMQLQRAAELLGVDINQQGTKQQMYNYLMNDDISIALIAANIADNENHMGRKLRGAEAGYAHNMGYKRYQDYLNGAPNPPKDNVAKRSEDYQFAIADALNGVINKTKDSQRIENASKLNPFANITSQNLSFDSFGVAYIGFNGFSMGCTK